MIPKLNKSPNFSDTYHFVTLLQVLSKVFEKLIFSEILLHFNSVSLHMAASMNTSTISNLHSLHHAYAVRNIKTPSTYYDDYLSHRISNISSKLPLKTQFFHTFLIFAVIMIWRLSKEKQFLQLTSRRHYHHP